MQRYMKGVAALALAMSLGACLDLHVENPNLPDRRRALSDPANVESIAALSTWLRWYSPLHSLANVAGTFPAIAGEASNTTLIMNVHWSQDPPQPFQNDELVSQVWMPRHGYDQWSQCIANANDALAQINEGMVIKTLDPGADVVRDNTDRAWAWAKLWQGVCIGYLALMLDRFALATEEEKLPEGWEALRKWETENLQETNWDKHFPLAIKAIEDAIKRMETGAQWVTPTTWVNGQSYNNQQIIQLGHTLIARMMIYSARTPADRQSKVDWNKVLYHTERGLTYDWGPTLQDGVITDPSYLARLNNTGSGSFRVNYQTIGPADQSGAYQNWIRITPRENAERFLIVTPDRRITGATPTSNGAYIRYVTATGGVDFSRGQQHWSWYGWWRRLNYQGANHLTGHFALATADENRLYRAEALMRLNRVAEAIPLINVTRTRAQRVGTTNFPTNLPAIPADLGANDRLPLVNNACVPRRTDGTCGSVWDALMYERDIELMGIEPTRSWMDRRGFGQLRTGVWVHLPVPARYLTSLGIPKYTFGGIGGEGSAVCTAPITCLVNP